MIFTFFFTAIVKDDPFFWCWLPRDEAIDIDCVDAGCKVEEEGWCFEEAS